MTAMPFVTDRRRQRSNQTYEAIRLQLQYVFEEHHLHNFALGDERGLVLSRAGDEEEADVLAAYAPLLARCTDPRRRAAILSRIAEHAPQVPLTKLSVREFHVDGQLLYMTIVGTNDGAVSAGLYRALTGVRRIFRQTSEVPAQTVRRSPMRRVGLN